MDCGMERGLGQRLGCGRLSPSSVAPHPNNNTRWNDWAHICIFTVSHKEAPMKTLADIFEHTLKDVYYAENAITKALPKVAKAAKSAELKAAAEQHLAETKDQIKTLDKVFKSVGLKASGEKCDAIEGLIKEADGLMEEAEGTALDAGLLAACQAVEHYEIARYGSLREWAKELGHDEAHKLLSEILDQEKASNNKLTSLAVSSVNKAPKGKKAA
jgi:ferritin-like metal-binding protein YciE